MMGVVPDHAGASNAHLIWQRLWDGELIPLRLIREELFFQSVKQTLCTFAKA